MSQTIASQFLAIQNIRTHLLSGGDNGTPVLLLHGDAAALSFALAHPERVEKLVLVDSYGLQERAPMHQLSGLFVHIPWMTEMTYATLKHSRSMTRASLSAIFANPQLSMTEELVDEIYAEVQKPELFNSLVKGFLS